MTRLVDTPDDFTHWGISPDHLARWEDGRRDTDTPGHGEVWYFDCHFDDGSTLVVGLRPKSPERVDQAGDNPNVAINYTTSDGAAFNDYRLVSPDQAVMSTTACDLAYGPHTLTGDWSTYDLHVAPEVDHDVVIEGATYTRHDTAMDLHFTARTTPFRPGTGIITFGEDDSTYYNFICITKLDVTGHLVINGEDKKVTGSAYYNHQWFDINPVAAFHHWVWGRQNIGEHSVLIYDMVASERFGLGQVPLFTVDDAQGNRIFENTTDDGVSVEVLETYVQQATGKRYPATMRYRFEHDDVQVEYTITKTQEIRVIDIYGTAPAPAREAFDRAHLHPGYTRYLGQAELSITRKGHTETSNGPILYEINYPGTENPDAHFIAPTAPEPIAPEPIAHEGASHE